MTDQAIYLIQNRYATLVRGNEFSPHDLRQTFASDSLREIWRNIFRNLTRIAPTEKRIARNCLIFIRNNIRKSLEQSMHALNPMKELHKRFIKKGELIATFHKGEGGNVTVKRTVSLVFSLSAMVCILLTTAISPSFGADANLDSYVTLKLGIYSPQEDPFKDFDTGLNGEISVGGYVTPNFGFELGVGYFESEGPGTILAPGSVVVPADGEFYVIPVTLNVKYLYPMGGFEPYAEAGVGVYVAEAELSGGGVSLSDNYTSIGGFLGGGVNFNITKNIFLGLEGRYHWVGRHKFELGQATQNVEIDGYTATANVGYRFSTVSDDGF